MADRFAVRVLLIFIAVTLLIVLIMQYNKKKSTTESFQHAEYLPLGTTNTEPFEELKQVKMADDSLIGKSNDNVGGQQQVRASESADTEDFKAVDFDTSTKMPNDCFPRDKITVDDLLPKDAANSKWAQVNPAGQGDVKDQNFLTAGMHIGVNTVGQTLRNPNLQLRSDPPNPRAQVSPWNQTTIEYDNSRRFFEVGEC